MITPQDLKASLANAVFWTGVLAIITTAIAGSYQLALVAAAVLLIDVALIALLPRQLTALARSKPNNGTVAFQITPLNYPKVLDADLNDFAPEFLRLDIFSNGQSVFSGNLARDTFKGLRDALNAALAKQLPQLAPARKVEKTSRPNAKR